MEFVGRLRIEIIRKGLGSQILINNCGTIDLCDIGPNLVIYPDNIIYSGATIKDIPEIITHLSGGPVVERLVLSPDTPSEQHRHDFYEAAVKGDATRPAPDFEKLASKFGFETAWISEQQRRGFIARKPVEEGDGETITVTKKARARYGV